ncbi:MAG: HypC/HybG/HupF family hydrogenase formation chaperone [Actinomycetota bacterium]|nr:HypC/HybG/HupF family hydrogenase formation chaperone [Actinomycetota bacterium]
MSSDRACEATMGHCITCGDEGIPMTVVAAGLCQDVDGQRHDVAVELVEPVCPGERLLVHAGVAIGRL